MAVATLLVLLPVAAIALTVVLAVIAKGAKYWFEEVVGVELSRV
jgi:hypothetical protein